MSDPMKNPDRDEKHRRRRGVGTGDSEEGPDGRELAEALYCGVSEPGPQTCDNCGKPLTENQDIGCTQCDPRARRSGMVPPAPTPSTSE